MDRKGDFGVLQAGVRNDGEKDIKLINYLSPVWCGRSPYHRALRVTPHRLSPLRRLRSHVDLI